MTKKKTLITRGKNKLLTITPEAIAVITKIAINEGITFKAKAQQVIEKYAKSQP